MMNKEQLVKELERAHERIAELEKRLVSGEDAHTELAMLHIKLVKKDHEREEAQRELRESEGRFRALFENQHSVMLLVDPATGRISEANQAAAHYYGYSVETLNSMSIMQINTLTPKQIAAEMDRATTEGRTSFEFKHRLANGEVRDVEVFSGPVWVHGKNLLYSIVHDISARKRVEDTLKIYKRLITSTSDMISLVDRKYSYCMVNDAYLTLFGKPREEIENISIEKLVGSNFFKEVSKPSLDRAFAGEIVNVDRELDLPGRQTVNLDVTYHPVKNDDGKIEYVSITARDMTSIKQSQKALQAFSDRLTLATDAGMIGIWEYEVISGNLIWDNIMMKLYKIDPAQFHDTYEDWRRKIHPEDQAKAETKLREAILNKTHFTDEFRIIWPNGQIRYIKTDALMQTGEDGLVERVTGVSQDITETRKLEEKLRRLATTDSLTGANNRRHFTSRGAEEFARSKRYTTPTTMLTLDIDHFKRVNDTYGHPAGDEVLKSLVTICRATLRTTDIFSRMGGEEFAALLPETGLEDGVKTAERLRKAVEVTRVMVEDEMIQYTISLGVSELQAGDKSLEDLMRRADRALYMAKDAGRNRVKTV